MAARLKLYNTLTREKVDFVPIDPEKVRMYVCGPTVYDFAHIGNARPVIVFDVLFRLLRHVYGADHVTYVRNITDVDDKINARALRDFGAKIADGSMTLNDAIRAVTEKTESQFHADVAALGCLKPTVEPRATDNIAQMVLIIQRLLDQGHAYVASGSEGREVLFATASMADYGQLSKRKLEDQQAGARIAVEAHKMNPGDFVLWKQSAHTEPGWNADFTFEGRTVAIHGRPGWHIECSAMSDRYLWEEIKDRLSPKAKARPHQFDIHGGGLDLIFPHHENEIAQTCCAFDTDVMANVWMHNGFVQVEGRKMSKSEGNFVTINELLETEKFGGRKWPGEVLRLAMLMTHYREPIDFSVKRLEEATTLYGDIEKFVVDQDLQDLRRVSASEVVAALSEDLDTYRAIETCRRLIGAADSCEARSLAFGGLELLGLVPSLEALQAVQMELHESAVNTARNRPEIIALVQAGTSPEAIGEEILKQALVFASPGTSASTIFRLFGEGIDFNSLNAAIAERREQLVAKNFAEADRIRDDLLAKGIQLKDGKDKENGERVTTWEVKR